MNEWLLLAAVEKGNYVYCTCNNAKQYQALNNNTQHTSQGMSKTLFATAKGF